MKIFFIIAIYLFNINILHAQISKKLLDEAVNYFNMHRSRFSNQEVISVIDFSKHNSVERFYLIDLRTMDVEAFLVAHGKNSDIDFDGHAETFSNIVDSLQSSLGAFRTGEVYYGENGISLRLDGLETSNSNARIRNIVIHGAEYVKPGKKIGRSFGCPALEIRYTKYVIDRISNGTLLYAGRSQN